MRNHSHHGFTLIEVLVALFVLPSVGRASLRSRKRSEAAGWALTMIALAVGVGLLLGQLMTRRR